MEMLQDERRAWGQERTKIKEQLEDLSQRLVTHVQKTHNDQEAMAAENIELRSCLYRAEQERDQLKAILESAQQQIASDQQRLTLCGL